MATLSTLVYILSILNGTREFNEVSPHMSSYVISISNTFYISDAAGVSLYQAQYLTLKLAYPIIASVVKIVNE